MKPSFLVKHCSLVRDSSLRLHEDIDKLYESRGIIRGKRKRTDSIHFVHSTLSRSSFDAALVKTDERKMTDCAGEDPTYD
jgi:hypothetical protein